MKILLKQLSHLNNHNQSQQGFLILPHPLTSFEIQKHYQNEAKLNSVYSKNDLPKTQDGGYVINVDGYKSIGTHWIASYVNGHNRRASYDEVYFESFGVEHIPKEIKKIHSKQKYRNQYLQNTSIRFDNVWIFLYWIC